MSTTSVRTCCTVAARARGLAVLATSNRGHEEQPGKKPNDATHAELQLHFPEARAPILNSTGTSFSTFTIPPAAPLGSMPKSLSLITTLPVATSRSPLRSSVRSTVQGLLNPCSDRSPATDSSAVAGPVCLPFTAVDWKWMVRCWSTLSWSGPRILCCTFAIAFRLSLFTDLQRARIDDDVHRGLAEALRIKDDFALQVLSEHDVFVAGKA